MDSDHELGVWPNVPTKRGVVAYRHIGVSECLERSYTIQFDACQARCLKDAGLYDNCFTHPADPDGALLVLGLASLCNHSDEPNTRTIARKEGAVGWVVEMYALRHIHPGDEITRGPICDQWFDLTDDDDFADDDPIVTKFRSKSRRQDIAVNALRPHY